VDAAQKVVVVGLRTTDLPYLNPLLVYLRSNQNLEKYFSKKDFFAMPKADLNELTDALKKDCPSPRSLWIFPGTSTNAAPQQRIQDCTPKAIHNFNIVIIFQCIRDTFEFKKDKDTTQIYLDGQFMELAEARRAVKKAITEFNSTLTYNQAFDFISWNSDEMLFPNEESNHLMSNSSFNTIILK
jgi:hypothetical protein